MNIQDFIQKVETEFDQITPGSLKPESEIKEFFEWDSINALVFIALVNVEYDVEINAEDLQQSQTVHDLYTLVESKSQERA
ncbi:MAG: acyl carrier protein [Bacteroidetes bacterium]|nr:acyl carrier protein [Bacteroidales bacterium]MBU1009741.1 acyl carrier protein [Bacteroidota bacterium]